MPTIDDFAYGLGQAPESWLDQAVAPHKTQAEIDAEDEAAAMARARKSNIMDLLPDAYVAGAVGAPRPQNNADVSVNRTAPPPVSIGHNETPPKDDPEERGNDFAGGPGIGHLAASARLIDSGGVTPPLDHLDPIQAATIRYGYGPKGSPMRDYTPESFQPDESQGPPRRSGNLVIGGGVTSKSIYPELAAKDALNDALAKDPFARERALASTQFGNQIALLREKAAIEKAVEDQRRQEWDKKTSEIEDRLTKAMGKLKQGGLSPQDPNYKMAVARLQAQHDSDLERLKQGFGFGEHMGASSIYKPGL